LEFIFRCLFFPQAAALAFAHRSAADCNWIEIVANAVMWNCAFSIDEHY